MKCKPIEILTAEKIQYFWSIHSWGGGAGHCPYPPGYANGQEVTGKFEYFSSRKQKPCHYYYEWTSSEEEKREFLCLPPYNFPSFKMLKYLHI
mgnify:CR=1 FL=1